MGFPCHWPGQVPMLLWLLLTLGTFPKAFLLLKPPWSTAFKGEKVTLTCEADHSPAQGYTSWYHNWAFWVTGSKTIQTQKSGHYACKTQRSSISDPVHVEFLSEWLILQASHPVFEGDDVDLRCRGKNEEDINEKIYYRNQKEIGRHLSKFTLRSVSRDKSEYHCTASGESFWGPWEETSKPLNIQVQELFPHPVLRVSTPQPIEGSPVNLKCETWLPPLRSYIELQFCFFREDKVLGSGWSSSPELQIPTMWSEDSGSYSCQANAVTPNISKKSLRSWIRVKRIPVSDVNLEIQPPGGQLIEGEDLALICSVAKGTGTVTFSWHREGTERSLGRKTQRALSAELRIAAVRQQDAGRYYCAADNMHGPILSRRIRVNPRIPASRPVLTLRTPRTRAMVGDMVELCCEAQRGSPPILYRFYHEDVTLGSSSAPSGGGASFNLSLTTEHSGNYSCEADNGLGAQRSEAVPLSVSVPVSRPVLTLNPARAQAVVGDLLELRCEAQSGSPPILYWFYHEDVTLGNSSAPSGGGASFNLSLTTEHSGNYSCGADNGLGVQRSYTVTLNFTEFSTNKVTHITVGVIGCLLSLLVLAASASLVSHFRTQRKSGGLATTGTPSYSPKEHWKPSWSGPPRTDPRRPTPGEPPALMELQPVYSNVSPGDDNLVYSQICSSQHSKENPGETPSRQVEVRRPCVSGSKRRLLIGPLKYEWDTERRHPLLPCSHPMAVSLPTDPCPLPPDPTHSLGTDTIVSHKHTGNI
ncbi:Fc receptor-like protein 3 isoform X5 [Ailuropoda melanoleuca]|uniref:Fc receptor-like protein 3 isoform X5 n=1 Tax=Ailuropoda melanoleuca TaxID=9646 RepID=UPI001494933C|nr:Fc receptor-like protein 3 isoform X5 [Ailuropoda melanoleuca]